MRVREFGSKCDPAIGPRPHSIARTHVGNDVGGLGPSLDTVKYLLFYDARHFLAFGLYRHISTNLNGVNR